MKRRHFFATLAGAIGVTAWSSQMRHGLTGYWGAVDVQRHWDLVSRGIHLHVFHQGQEVTTRCYFFDDRLDYCECFKVDPQGRKYRKGNGAARETLHGIEIREGPPFPQWESVNARRG